MSLLDRLLGERRASVVGSKHPRDPGLAAWFGGGATLSGQAVTPDSAMGVAAVYSAVRLLSDTIGWLPLIVYRRMGEDAGGRDLGRTRDRRHALSAILGQRPNRWQTAIEFKQMMMGHLALRGNAYAEIVAGPTAAVRELIPLHPDRVMPYRAPDGSIAYRYQPDDGAQRVLLQGEVMHLRGLTADGITGMSPIALHREGIGLAMATERHGAALFGNSAAPKGAIAVPAVLTDTAAANLRDSWERRHRGIENAGRLAILDGGMQWTQIGLTSEDAQYIETRKLQVAEIARMFRVPPHMIGDLDRATFSNIEEQGLDFVTYSLNYWCEIWQQAVERDLFVPADRETHFVEFLLAALLRGNLKSRYEAYAIGRQWGWLSPNDIRRLENDNPIEDGGDVYLSPMNMTTADLLMQALKPPPAPAPGPGARANGHDNGAAHESGTTNL